MLSSSKATLSKATLSKLALLPLIGVLAIGCAQGLNDPDGTDWTSGAGGSFTSTSATGGFKTTVASSTVTSTTVATTGVATTAVTSGTFSQAATTSGGGTCDALGDCGSCGNCAIAGQCATEMNACETDQNCNALLGCLDNCQDQTCADSCATQYPGGQAGYTAFVSCIICDACPVTCDAAMGGCGP